MNKLNSSLSAILTVSAEIVLTGVLVISLMQGCTTQRKLHLSSSTHSISMKVQAHPVECDMVARLFSQDCFQLDFTFKAKDTSSLIFDHDEISIECASLANNSIIEDSLVCMDSLLSKLRTSQFLLENRNGELRFFSNFPSDEKGRIPAFFCHSFGFDYEPLILTPGKPLTISSQPLGKRFLLVRDTDSQVRAHYIFIPGERRSKNGIQAFAISSNWVDFN